MKTEGYDCFYAPTVSEVWSKALVRFIDSPCDELSPLLLRVLPTQGSPLEAGTVRAALDALLTVTGELAIHKVAETICPDRYLRLVGGDRARFYELYLKTLPRQVFTNRVNANGTYFSRLIAFDMDARTGQRPEGANSKLPHGGNQLENIIQLLSKPHPGRDSALQAAIFDPARDHSKGAQQAFPCMQHVTFMPRDDQTLAVNAFYATQQLMRKAYGNLLGLAQLGRFVGDACGRPLSELNVFVGCEKLVPIDGAGRTSEVMQPVIEAARALSGSGPS